MPNDLLIQRLESLPECDLRSLLVGGLRLKQERLQGHCHRDLVLLCSSELRAAAGSTLMNLTRTGQNFPYKQLLIDVADKLAIGSTPLSWTKYRIKDGHAPEEIETVVLELFEERTRKWWDRLSDDKRKQFVNDINTVLRGEVSVAAPITEGVVPYLQQQVLEQIIQTGVVTGMSKVAGGGLLGYAGVSLVGQLGWILLLQTVGWMTGLKMALFGIGGYGALGGAVTWIGATTVGGLVAIPGLFAIVDGPAYRKTVPTTVMMLASIRRNEIG